MRGVTPQSQYVNASLPFQLTRLMRGVTKAVSTLSGDVKFQLTRLMRGVTAAVVMVAAFLTDFNSHASCEA